MILVPRILYPNPNLSHVVLSDKEAQGGLENCQKKPIEIQEGVPSGVGVPHVLNGCASAQLAGPSLDCQTPATTVPSHDPHHV